MEKFRFVGVTSDIGGVGLRRFGQAVELTEEAALDACMGGCALIRDEDFEALEFTEQELSLYAYTGPREGAPEAFMEKFTVAQGIYREARG